VHLDNFVVRGNGAYGVYAAGVVGGRFSRLRSEANGFDGLSLYKSSDVTIERSRRLGPR
jgi:hypothetical protein